MVICQELHQWLTQQDPTDETASRRIEDHIRTCRTCKELYAADVALDDVLKKGLQTVNPPAGLIMRARQRIESESRPRRSKSPILSFFRIPLFKSPTFRIPWKTAVPAVSMALIVLLFLNPFSGPLRTVDDVVNHSIANHLDADMKMTFRAGEVPDINRWFTSKLNYAVQVPDLKQLDLSLVGGRKCTLGKTDTALLFCHRNGHRASIFVIDQKDINFNLEKKRKYIVEEDNLRVTLWKQSGLLYVLVI